MKKFGQLAFVGFVIFGILAFLTSVATIATYAYYEYGRGRQISPYHMMDALKMADSNDESLAFFEKISSDDRITDYEYQQLEQVYARSLIVNRRKIAKLK